MKKVKFYSSILVALCMLLGFVLPSFADEAQPRYSNSNTSTISLNFNSGKATCIGSINGRTGTTSITNCNVTLKNSSGLVVASWNNLSSNSSTLNFSKSTSVSRGTYTLSFTAKVNVNGTSENISNSVTKTY